MDLRSGKTIRRCVQHIPQDSLLEINYDIRDKSSISLFGHEFNSGVQYSMKKKCRWELPNMMCKETYDEDQPIMYSKHQCIKNCEPLLDLYLYDSILDKEIGKTVVSNQHLERGNFNAKSLVYQIENRLNYTKKERDLFEKSKSPGKRKSKQSRNTQRPQRVLIPEESEELPTREEYVTEKALRQDCVRVNEYIHVNNIPAFKNVPPYRNLWGKMAKNRVAKKDKENFKTMFLEDDDWDEEVVIVEPAEKEETIKQFVLTTKDFVCRQEPAVSRKRRRKKKSESWKKDLVEEVDRNFVESTVAMDTHVVDLHEDLLPCVAIETRVVRFVNDILRIGESCHCRLGDSNPSVISLDLDQSVESESKSFILLKPMRLIDDNDSVIVKVVFNISDRTAIDFNEIFDLNFDSVLDLVSFVQLRLNQTTTKRYSSNRKLVTLDGKVDGMLNLWKTRETDVHKPLYLQHKEWQSCEISEKVMYEISRYVPVQTAECSVCFSEVNGAEMFVVKSCGHIVCEICMGSHIVFRLETGMREIICPGSECDATIDATVMLSLVSWKRYCKRLEILESAMIKQSGSLCSFCGAVLIDHMLEQPKTKRKIIEYKCVCENIICSRCGHEHHFPSTCNEMMKHKTKMTELKDSNIQSLKVKPLFYKGRPCPTCFQFVVKNGGCNHISCNCGTHFCWGCGDSMGRGRHLNASFPCLRIEALVTHDLTKLSFVPNPSSIRPRLYCAALYHHISNNNYYSARFYARLKSIFHSNYSPDDSVFMLAQISELSTVIEYMFVKAYQIDKRTQINTFRFIKSSVSLFLFYQQRIKAIVDSIQSDNNKSMVKVLGRRSLTEYCQKLTVLVKEVQGHLNRFSHFFER